MIVTLNLRFMLFVIVALATASACDREQPPSRTPNAAPAPERSDVAPVEPHEAASRPTAVRIRGEFGDRGALPRRDAPAASVAVAPEVRDALQSRFSERLAEALATRGRTVDAQAEDVIEVKLGGEGPAGLRITLSRGQKAVHHDVVPAELPAEAVANLDHSLARLLAELGL